MTLAEHLHRKPAFLKLFSMLLVVYSNLALLPLPPHNKTYTRGVAEQVVVSIPVNMELLILVGPQEQCKDLDEQNYKKKETSRCKLWLHKDVSNFSGQRA